MQMSMLDNEAMEKTCNIIYLIGSDAIVKKMKTIAPLAPFDDICLDFLNELSKELMACTDAKKYPDIVTLGFWIRKASMLKLKMRFVSDSENIVLGRGITFHVAPSNVPVNYMYSLVSGLITGNACIVRVPSRNFSQVTIINRLLNKVLNKFEKLKDYVCLVRYKKNKNINDYFSFMADVRIIWGGDKTIAELRKSPLKPRATEITFADRYSFAIIDSELYLDMDRKEKIAERFYNDTFLTDQNACTSPKLIVWTGNNKRDAKQFFWRYVHDLVKKKYKFQPIMSINKLTNSYLMAVAQEGIHIVEGGDNYIVRIQVPELNAKLIEMRGNTGYFFEYDCDDIMELKWICNDQRCQTIGLLGKKDMIKPLLLSGIKGVDRVVPVGKTMDFDLIWDGYNLYERLTRIIKV